MAGQVEPFAPRHDRARRYQDHLVPGIDDGLDAPRVTADAFQAETPCDELGGDILNVLPLCGRSVGMYLLDVSGHGVPAALLSVTLSRILTTSDAGSTILMARDQDAEGPAIIPPSEVAERLNRRFPMSGQRNQYFTMVYAVLDAQTGMLRHAIAGHPHPLLMRPGRSPQPLTGGSFPIGMIEDAEFDEESIQLEPGDRLYFYSDGITEAVNSQGVMLQAEGLIRLIEGNQAASLNDALASCVEEFKRWCDSAPFTDDISLLALEIPVADCSTDRQ